jgi:hypothetical protein
MQSEFTSRMVKGVPQAFYLAGMTNPFLIDRLCAAHIKSGRPPPYIVDTTTSSSKIKLKYSQQDRTLGSNNVPGGFIKLKAADTGLQKDYVFLQSLQKMAQQPNLEIGRLAIAIQRHFSELTALFMAPLARYIAGLNINHPPMKSSSLDQNPAESNMFSELDFLDSLSKYGTSIKFKGNSASQRDKLARRFYQRFCQTTNFFSWLELQQSSRA